jgi:hypothetical protein
LARRSRTVWPAKGLRSAVNTVLLFFEFRIGGFDRQGVFGVGMTIGSEEA